MKRILFLVAILGICLIWPVSSAWSAKPPTVFVSILPQKYFVQQISGNKVHVEVMVPPGADPHTYEPKPSQMRNLAEAIGYFTIGVELENSLLERITALNPDMIVVHTEDGIERIAMEGSHHHEEEDTEDGDHAHGNEDHHGAHEEHKDHEAHKDHEGREGREDHEAHEEHELHEDHEAHRDHGDHGDHENGLDPHIWLSPALVKLQAETIKSALQKLDPDNGAVYDQNYRGFVIRIDELDKRLQSILAGKQGMKFMVFHPSWGYFARSYGLEQVAVEVEGKSPKPAHLQELIEMARREHIDVIFAQPQFSRKSAEVIAREIGAQVVLIDPLGENWFENMTLVTDKLHSALR